MMKCYLDSNVLMYWQNDAALLHAKSTDIIEKLQRDKISIYISPLVIDEYIHAMRVEARINKFHNLHMVAKKALNDLLALPLLKIIPTPADIQSQKQMLILMETYSLHPRDAYHLLTMQANDIVGFATFDKDFEKVFAAKIIEKV